jgi:hypothetical protein
MAAKFEQIASTQLIVSGCVLFGASFLIGPAHARPAVSFPNPPTQMNQSTPYVPQPSYAPPSSATPGVMPAHEAVRTHSDQQRGRSTVARSMLESSSPACGYYGCARAYPWTFSSYAAPAVTPASVYTASAVWSPGYYDYASGQLGRGRPPLEGMRDVPGITGIEGAHH